MIKSSPDCLNNPDLVLVSVVVPLDDFGLLLGFSFADVQCLVAPASDVVSWLSLVFLISNGNELPEFVFLLVWLAAVNLNTVFLLSFRNFNSQVVL
jgi:hypothetical protein